MNAVPLNNQALMAEQSGDFATAERLHLQAIQIKEQALGPENPTTALSYNAIGELYLKMQRLDDAESYLTRAVRIRNSSGTALDAAISRENIAQLYELRGDLSRAKQIRSSVPDHVVCAYHHCPGQTFQLKQLKVCGKCKSAYYCSAACQGKDWNSRHKPLCTAA
ncbi:hypothetical protein CPC08DRAFT_746233 [Agrocybe pediades]|nr:hypothetical protein CPC08DRAFT_746233 [Agrocybe pediades]